MSTRYHTPAAGSITQNAVFLGRLIAAWVANLRNGSSHLHQSDQVFLSDLTRGRYAAAHAAFARMMDCSVNAETDEAAFAFGNEWNATVAARRAERRAQTVLPLSESFVAETRADAEHDIAIALVFRDKSPTAITRAMNATLAMIERAKQQVHSLAHCLHTGRVS